MCKQLSVAANAAGLPTSRSLRWLQNLRFGGGGSLDKRGKNPKLWVKNYPYRLCQRLRNVLGVYSGNREVGTYFIAIIFLEIEKEVSTQEAKLSFAPLAIQQTKIMISRKKLKKPNTVYSIKENKGLSKTWR